LGTAGDNQSTISYSRCPAGKSLGLGDPSIPTSDSLLLQRKALSGKDRIKTLHP
jgi:hypothetical protein